MRTYGPLLRSAAYAFIGFAMALQSRLMDYLSLWIGHGSVILGWMLYYWHGKSLNTRAVSCMATGYVVHWLLKSKNWSPFRLFVLLIFLWNYLPASLVDEPRPVLMIFPLQTAEALLVFIVFSDSSSGRLTLFLSFIAILALGFGSLQWEARIDDMLEKAANLPIIVRITRASQSFWILLCAKGTAVYRTTGRRLERKAQSLWFRERLAPRGYYQYKPIHGKNHIRVLKLHPHIQSTELSCELKIVALDKAASNYEAISYTWGSSDRTHFLKVDGSILKIPKSAHDVLQDRTCSWTSRTLWLDAVCINQDDDIEKGMQVMLMKEIYLKASRVVVMWSPRKDAHLAFGILARLLRRQKLPASAMSEQDKSPENSIQDRALGGMLSQDWFSRVWVLQEISWAKTVHVRYNSIYLRWEDIAQAIEVVNQLPEAAPIRHYLPRTDLIQAALRLKRMPLDELVKGEYHGVLPDSKELLIAGARMARFRKLIQGGKGISLADAMLQCAFQRATDPRDKVYGILGLISDEEKSNTFLKPDYKVPVEKLYSDAARHCLKNGEFAGRILALAGIGWQRSYNKFLPSWVPDWTRIDPYRSAMAPMADAVYDSYNATGATHFQLLDSMSSESIILSICIVDTVDVIGSVSKIPIPTSRRTSDDSDVMDVLNSWYSWHEEARELAVSHARNRYPELYNLRDAFWRTLIRDYSHEGKHPAPSNSLDDYKACLAFLVLPVRNALLESKEDHKDSKDATQGSNESRRLESQTSSEHISKANTDALSDNTQHTTNKEIVEQEETGIKREDGEREGDGVEKDDQKLGELIKDKLEIDMATRDESGRDDQEESEIAGMKRQPDIEQNTADTTQSITGNAGSQHNEPDEGGDGGSMLRVIFEQGLDMIRENDVQDGSSSNDLARLFWEDIYAVFLDTGESQKRPSLTKFMWWFMQAPETRDDDIFSYTELLKYLRVDEQYSVEKYACWRRWEAASAIDKGRRFGVTKSQRLAILPQKCEADDIIGLVPGVKVPLVFRRSLDSKECEDGTEMSLSLVGEAYVHGIMDGELLVSETESDGDDLILNPVCLENGQQEEFKRYTIT